MASVKLKVDGRIISNALQAQLAEVNNPTTMLAIHNTLAKYCDPYVPFQEGTLSQTHTVTAEGVTYTQPYARYQYYGEVYGPNIPIVKSGEIVGWFSPPGQKKHPTGQYMQHSTEKHPLASSFWDKAMLRDHRLDFNREIKDIIQWRIKQANAGR